MKKEKEAQRGSAGLRDLFHITVGTAVGMLREIKQRMEAEARCIMGSNDGKETERRWCACKERRSKLAGNYLQEGARR